jgi:hypothetical protein
MLTGLKLWRTYRYGEDINRAWENIKDNIKTSAKESLGLYGWMQHKPWFDEEYSRSLYQSRLKCSGQGPNSEQCR